MLTHRTNLIAFAFLFFITACVSAFAAKEKRVALVMGNSDYSNAISLPNPQNDARLMSATLEANGFKVLKGINLSKRDMQSLLDEFIEIAYDADLALVFYAGHGMQVDGKNFLIPVDVELTRASHLKTRTIPMDDLIEALPQDPAIGVVIIDACRDNPLARTYAASLPATRSTAVNSGLAALQTTGSGNGSGGLIIGYATDPGAVAMDGDGVNSPYTRALVRHIATPGVNIQSALTRVRGDVVDATKGRQRPWYNASLGREIFIGGAAPSPTILTKATPADAATFEAKTTDVAAVSPASSDKNWEVEQRLWDSVSKANTVDHYNVYLAKYPDGNFASIARLNIEAMTKRQKVASLQSQLPSPARATVTITDDLRKNPGTAITEDMLALNREQRKGVQLRLKSLGFDPKGVDGGLGKNSRKAIVQWQQSLGIIQTGYLSQQQYHLLLEQSQPGYEQALAAHQAQQAKVRERRKSRKTYRRKTKTTKNGNGSGLNNVLKFGAAVGAGMILCKATGC